MDRCRCASFGMPPPGLQFCPDCNRLLDWPRVAAWLVNRSFSQLPTDMWQDAVDAAIARAAEADARWSPEGGRSHVSWLIQQMRYGVIDFVRRHGGREEQSTAAVRRKVNRPGSLEDELAGAAADDSVAVEAVEAADELRRLRARTPLTPREAEWFDAEMAGVEPMVLAARWGTTPNTVYRTKFNAIARFRQAARAA